MELVFQTVFWVLLVDSIGAILITWNKNSKLANWYKKDLTFFSRYFPLTKGWATYYFILVLWIGVIINHFGLI